MQGTSCSKQTWQLKSFVRERWGFTVIMRLINRHNYFVGKLIKEMMVRWKLKQLFSKSMNMSLRSSKLSNLLQSPLFQKQNKIACTKIEWEHARRLNSSNSKWFGEYYVNMNYVFSQICGCATLLCLADWTTFGNAVWCRDSRRVKHTYGKHTWA